MAKVKVQVDPTKDRPRHVWIGLDDEDLTIGRWQPIEKELGAELKNMNKGEQGQQGGEHRQIKTREQEEQQQQKTKAGSSEQQPEQQKEEEWQLTRRRNNKSQEERTQKTMWRPASP
ncbi:hypothetical protein H5410_036486 [Solanum commersonii]|uniref:Uncharacterized protein n=1 Tax=Solanum commersonii TaxID=4109 RepID=A0A9J5Y8A6_SOLCO|nr:hypothetical protein H5410_036486 [Solanum commersonii]